MPPIFKVELFLELLPPILFLINKLETDASKILIDLSTLRSIFCFTISLNLINFSSRSLIFLNVLFLIRS